MYVYEKLFVSMEMCAVAKRKMVFVVKRKKFEGNCSELAIANVNMNR